MEIRISIGKAVESIWRLKVKAFIGRVHPRYWRGGWSGEELPYSKRIFDTSAPARFHLRYGERQVSLQFEEFRVVGGVTEIVKQRALQRFWTVRAERKISQTASLRGTLIWAEGAGSIKSKAVK